MNELLAKIEALLFVSARPVSYTKLASALEIGAADVKQAVQELATLRNADTSGIHIVVSDSAAELATNPAFAQAVSTLTARDEEAPLTRPQLETLTVIAYRGPVTKSEIEYIRGVNCTAILRNLLMRGLIIEREDADHMEPVYVFSTEMLRHLGLHSVEELPDYKTLHNNGKINQMIEEFLAASDV